MNTKQIVIVLLSSALVSVLADDRFGVRKRRGFWDDKDNDEHAEQGLAEDSDIKNCPKVKQDCPLCLTELSPNDYLCSNDLVADIRLIGDPECGQMKILKMVKLVGFDPNSNYSFSMAKSCQQCDQLFNKDVILITNYNSFDYLQEGFSLGNETRLILGVSPIQDCTHERRSISPEPTNIVTPSVTTTTSATIIDTATEAITEFSTLAPIFETSVANNWENEVSNKIDGSQDKGRRNVEQPEEANARTPGVNVDPVDTVGTMEPSTGGTSGEPGTAPPSNVSKQFLSSIMSLGSKQVQNPRSLMPSYGSKQISGNNYEYPHTQTEYNSPVYSPYSKPPGYLNTGYFTAQSLQYGAGKPPAVNPVYYYLSKSQPYDGPRYQPSRLNPKPLYYPILASPAPNYRPQPIASYGQTYHPMPTYSAPPPPNYSNQYWQAPSAQLSPSPYGNTLVTSYPPIPYSPPVYQHNNGYSQPSYSNKNYNTPQNYSSQSYSNYTSGSYGMQPSLSYPSTAAQPIVPLYGPQPSVPSYGSPPAYPSYNSQPPLPYNGYRLGSVYNSTPAQPYVSQPPNMTYAYKSPSNYSNRNSSIAQYSQQSYTTPSNLQTYNSYLPPNQTSYSPTLSYSPLPSVPSYGSQASVASYGSQPSVPSYGVQASIVPSYSYPPPVSSYSSQQTAQSYQPSRLPGYRSSSYSANYSLPQSYIPDKSVPSISYSSGTYSSQSYPSGQALPSYGSSLSQPYASGYSAVQSYSSAYSTPTDYYASSSNGSEQVTAPFTASNSCPKCIEDVAEPDLIDSLCDFASIFVAMPFANSADYVSNKSYSATYFVHQVIRDKEVSLKENLAFSYLVRDDCKCQKEDDSAANLVIMLTKRQSWKTIDASNAGHASSEAQIHYYLLPNDQSLVLKYSDLHKEDLQRILKDKNCV